MKIKDTKEIEVVAKDGLKKLKPDTVRFTVGSAVCGLSKGAKETLEALRAEIANAGLNAEVVSVGCNGLCFAEPLVEVIAPRMPKVTYGPVTSEKVPELVKAVKAGQVLKGIALFKTAQEQLLNGTSIQYGGSSDLIDSSEFHPLKGQVRVVMRNAGLIDPLSIEEYMATGGFSALTKVLTEKNTAKVIKEVETSGLRGRGGAGFPTGLKWKTARETAVPKKYVVVNCSEGDPEVGMHRALIESDPLSVIEGMMICAFAIGASEGYIYISDKLAAAEEKLKVLIGKLSEAGLLGEKIMGTDFSFTFTMKQSTGAYISGEETALLNALEGEMTEPRPRPPFPAKKGLFGMPTVVNNVETLMNIPPIVLKGGAWYAGYGVEGSSGTKVLAITGDCERTMTVEVPLGTKIKDVISMAGGVKGKKALKGFQIGGPGGGILPAKKSTLPLDYQKLWKEKTMLASGLVLMDEDTDMVNMARFFIKFFEEESCGKCVPCREGSHRVGEVLDNIIRGTGAKGDLDYLLSLEEPINDTSACALGKTLLAPVSSTIKNFPEDYAKKIGG
jgi:NADH:ubiquinone oxidoreductase subunit F (NADH-binding)/(2Fe-2S) ferredoxin